MRGTIWLAVRTPLQAVLALWTVPLMRSFGDGPYGAYGFAMGFGFIQFLFEFGMSSALSRQVSDAWTRGDRGLIDRTVRSGVAFYAVMAMVQAGVMIAIAMYGIPPRFSESSRDLVTGLLWLQAITAPCYGASVILTSILHAARRYDVVPRFELLIVVFRFVILYVGLRAGLALFWVVALQTAVQVLLGLLPALWVIARELGYRMSWGRVVWGDFAGLWKVGFAMALIQLSVVLADKLDTTILGYALAMPERGLAVYQVVSKPFLQLRQTAWMLSSLVLPAAASLAATRDERSLSRIGYDGTRSMLAFLCPVGILAFIHARVFLDAWVGDFLEDAWMMQLFLVACLPAVLSILVQMSIGKGHIWPIAAAALTGSLVNLPISYLLTRRLGVSGVIWGTVLTTLVSNGLVPGVYVFRVLNIDIREFWSRTLFAPMAASVALVMGAVGMGIVWPARRVGEGMIGRFGPLTLHVLFGCLVFGVAYGVTARGRGDVLAMARRLGWMRSGGGA
jgi:hypothetical protein